LVRFFARVGSVDLVVRLSRSLHFRRQALGMANRTHAEQGALELAEHELRAVEAAVARLSGLLVGGLREGEQAQLAGLRQIARRLVEIAGAIQSEGLTVAGSKDQVRPHPLLGEERALRRQLGEELRKVEYRLGERARLERLNALSRRAPVDQQLRPAAAEDAPSPRGRSRSQAKKRRAAPS
jgi:hypothetical protein